VSRGEQRRQAREGGSEMKKLYIVLAAVAVVGIGAVGYSVGTGSGSAVSEPIALEGMDDLEHLVALAQGVTKGDQSSKITIIEFGDFECPGCGAFATQVQPQVDLMYVNPGKAKFVFYDWPITGLHANAFLAARAARCGGDQGKYWEYHDLLYQQQPRWAALPEPIDTFVSYAETLELDGGAFRSCLNSDKFADVVTANMQLGEQLGVNGTPTVMIERGGAVRRVGSDFQSISSYLNQLLSEEEGGA
jgi:protein-disulfide isomerase